jgi:hypothetical protein
MFFWLQFADAPKGKLSAANVVAKHLLDDS